MDSRTSFTTRFRVFEAEYNPIPENFLVSRIEKSAEASGINISPITESKSDDSTLIKGRISKYGLEGHYEWEVRRKKEDGQKPHDFKITESLYLSADYKFNFALLSFLLVVIPIIQLNIFSRYILIKDVVFSGLGILGVCFLVYSRLPMYLFPRGLNEADDTLRIISFTHQTTRLQLLQFGAVVVPVISPDVLQPIASIGSILALVTIGILSLIDFESVSGDVTKSGTIRAIPTPMVEFATTMVVLIIPSWAIRSGYFQPARFSSTILVILLGLVAARFAIWFSRQQLNLSFKLFDRYGKRGSQSAVYSWGLYVVASIVSVAAVIVPIKTSMDIIEAFGGANPVLTLGLGMLVAIPAAYPICGVVYQLYQSVRTVHKLFTVSEAESLEDYNIPTDKVEAEFRVYDDPIVSATGLSTINRDVIFVTEKTADKLDKEAFRALIAHEDAHASIYSDGKWGVFGSMVASLTFVGQNVLFAALDFTAREIRADKHAVKNATADGMKRALDVIYAEETEQKLSGSDDLEVSPQDLPGSSSSPAVIPSGETFGRVFKMFYGGYTLGKAHPQLTLRKEKIDEYEQQLEDTH